MYSRQTQQCDGGIVRCVCLVAFVSSYSLTLNFHSLGVDSLLELE